MARGEIGPANLDSPELDLTLGGSATAQPFQGDLDEVRLYRRALGEAEIQGLLQPGNSSCSRLPPGSAGEAAGSGDADPRRPSVLRNPAQPAFLVVRLEAGPLQLPRRIRVRDLDRVVLTPLPDTTTSATSSPLRSDCRDSACISACAAIAAALCSGRTPQTVAGEKLTRYVFEGTMRNFPAPEVEKDNVNYLAGVHEIGVRSEYTDGRDMPRLLIRSVEFEGPY